MKTFKQIAATLMALTLVSSFTAFAGCGDKQENSSLESSSSTESTPTGECATKGHDYNETPGWCVRCGEKAVIPALSSTEKFPLVEICTHGANCPMCDYVGAGEMFDRLELEEGCYTVEIAANGELWLSFSAKEAGQYALHSVGGRKGVKATRHAANSSYVNELGIAAVEEGEDFYAYDNCGTAYYNAEWRSTYCLKNTTTEDLQIKIRFVRIADPAWEATTIRTKVYAQELTKKAEKDTSSALTLVDVPYTSEYFYDETLQYYRMGSKDAPGAIIYAAIDKAAPRLFGEAADGENVKFTTVLKNSGTALNLSDGKTENGDYNVLCYTPFIMNWKNEDASWGARPGSTAQAPEADLEKVCYQNYCNEDGVYPVNQELFKFLNLYVKANKPADENISAEDWDAQEEYLWLSACYYYEQIQEGTKENPKVLQEGENTITLGDPATYCVIEGTGSYTLRCTVENVTFIIDGTILDDLTEITVEGGQVFRLRDGDYATVTVTIEVVKTE